MPLVLSALDAFLILLEKLILLSIIGQAFA